MRRLVRPRRGDSRDPRWFTWGDRVLRPDEVLGLLEPYLTEQRMVRIDRVLGERTYSLAVVVEGIVDTGNVAAVMRTADAFGVQTFHAIDTAGGYKHSKRTAQGAEKWLDRRRWRDAASCVAHLRSVGYRLAGAHLDASAIAVDDVDFSVPTALVFGNELGGLSDELLAACDVTITVPMAGFVQSLNVSVAAAICLWQAHRDRVERLGSHGDLSDADRERLRAVFAMKSVRHHRELIERLLGDATGP
jgi:tRNA (guanosine-2'-O-)-methyltransferase